MDADKTTREALPLRPRVPRSRVAALAPQTRKDYGHSLRTAPGGASPRDR